MPQWLQTNIIIFEVLEPYSAVELSYKLAEYDVKAIAISPTQIRMVFHLDVTAAHVDRLLQIIGRL
jgi:threonine aldolase